MSQVSRRKISLASPTVVAMTRYVRAAAADVLEAQQIGGPVAGDVAGVHADPEHTLRGSVKAYTARQIGRSANRCHTTSPVRRPDGSSSSHVRAIWSMGSSGVTSTDAFADARTRRHEHAEVARRDQGEVRRVVHDRRHPLREPNVGIHGETGARARGRGGRRGRWGCVVSVVVVRVVAGVKGRVPPSPNRPHPRGPET